MKKPAKELILKLLKEKSSLKQDVYSNTYTLFRQLKDSIKDFVAATKGQARKIDERIIVDFRDKGEFEMELRVAGDILIFHMHTNVFEFDKSHPVWKMSYVKDAPLRSYCGVINVYNFLSDSFRYNRTKDIGYLIARIFINHENHFFAEGKRQLGFLYNDFPNSVMSRDTVNEIVESAVLYCLDFDLLTPPFDAIKEVSVGEMLEASSNMQMKTGKRLGFRFQADTDQIE